MVIAVMAVRGRADSMLNLQKSVCGGGGHTPPPHCTDPIGLQQGCLTPILEGPSVCRYFWFIFDQRPVKRARFMGSLASKLITSDETHWKPVDIGSSRAGVRQPWVIDVGFLWLLQVQRQLGCCSSYIFRGIWVIVTLPFLKAVGL